MRKSAMGFVAVALLTVGCAIQSPVRLTPNQGDQPTMTNSGPTIVKVGARLEIVSTPASPIDKFVWDTNVDAFRPVDVAENDPLMMELQKRS